MIKHYKNIKNVSINLMLYGLGKVNILANTPYVEIDEEVANAINRMVYPDTLLEEIDVKTVAEEIPIAKSAIKRIMK